MQKDEELTYTVYFGFIKLGEVSFKLKNTFNEDKHKYYSANAVMKSYEGIPFLGVYYIFESLMRYEKNSVIAIEFNSTDFKESGAGKEKVNTQYLFEYDSNHIHVNKYSDLRKNDVINYPDTIEKGRYYQDGLSIFYNARLNSLQKGAGSNRIIDVYINEKKSVAKYSFDFNRTSMNSDIADYDIAVFKLAGVADFVGVLGLTGEFDALISDDDARIPLKAKFKISIGSVVLELTNYNRKGWIPPKFSD